MLSLTGLEWRAIYADVIQIFVVYRALKTISMIKALVY